MSRAQVRPESRRRPRPRGTPPRAADPSAPTGDPRTALFLLAVCFLVALLWRLAFLDRLSHTPLVGTLRGDEKSYWDWATFLVRHHFVGTNAFFQGPLYPYVLAITRVLAGPTVRQVLLVQAVWGATAVALLVEAVRRSVGAASAACIGVLLALNTMWVFFDALILTESLLLLLGSALILSWVACPTSRRPRLVAVGGAILIGLMSQCRATELALLPVHLVFVRANLRRRGIGWRGPALLGAALCLLTLLPSALWNRSRAHAFIPFTYNGGINLYIGNNPQADGAYQPIQGTRLLGTPNADSPDGSVESDGREYLEKHDGLRLGPGESDTFWAGQAVGYMRTHPLATLARMGRKLLLMLNWQETPQIEHLVTFQRLAGPVGLPGLGAFLVFAAGGIAGLLLMRRHGLFAGALGAAVCVRIAATLPFFVTDRYRIHLLPELAVLSAMFLSDVWRAVAARSRREAWPIAGALVCGLILALIPVSTVDRGYEDWLSTSDVGVRWLEVGDTKQALAAFSDAVRQERGLAGRSARWEASSQDRAELHFNYGVALRRGGRLEDGIGELANATRLDPTNAHYLRTLGDAYLVQGRTREADSLLARVPALVGGDAEMALSEGYRAAREGRLAEAEEALQRAAKGNSRLFGAWGALMTVQVLRGETREARSTWNGAAAAGMPRVSLNVYEGLVDAAEGDSVGAGRAVKSSLVDGLDPSLERVTRLTRDILSGAVKPPRAEPH